MIKRRRVDESHQHRVRYEAQQPFPPRAHAEAQLEDPGQERQQCHVRVELLRFASGRAAPTLAAVSNEVIATGPVANSSDEPNRTPKNRGNDGEGRNQPVLRRHAGELCVREPLRDGHQRHGDARDQISAQRLTREARPSQERKQTSELEGHARAMSYRAVRSRAEPPRPRRRVILPGGAGPAPRRVPGPRRSDRSLPGTEPHSRAMRTGADPSRRGNRHAAFACCPCRGRRTPGRAPAGNPWQ